MPVAGKEQDPMNRWFRAVVAFVLVMVFATGAAATGVIAGPARVIDGDTIVVADVRLRIFGIDAPESRQTCAAQ
jgi:endonuclease YncB( thermonuclease family)